MVGTPDEKLLLEPVRRVTAFERLAEAPVSRAELQEELDVSRATLHRVVTNLTDADLAVETDDGVTLTPLGREVASAVTAYAGRVATAERVAPLLNTVEPAELPVEMPADVFAEAEVLRPAPSQPQRPVQRVLSAVETAGEMRALAPVVLPAYVDAVHEAVLDSTNCELVLSRVALDGLRESYTEQLREAGETGRVDVRVAESLPFGLLLTPGTVCVVAYDDDDVLRAAVAGDDARLRDWAEDCWAHYAAASEPVPGVDAGA